VPSLIARARLCQTARFQVPFAAPDVHGSTHVDRVSLEPAEDRRHGCPDRLMIDIAIQQATTTAAP